MAGVRRRGRARRDRVALLGAVLALVITFGVVVHAAGASRGAAAVPLAIQSASVVQDGQDLVWQVELAEPFSPEALHREGRSLCLLIEPASSGSVDGELCLSGPRRGAVTPELVYMSLTPRGPGPGSPIAATVTRSSDQELTASFVPAGIGLGYRSLRWQVLSAIQAPGCGAAPPVETGCAALLPSAPTLVRLHTPRLVGCSVAGPDWVFQGPRDKRDVALTFDDGPWWDPPTSQFVSLLAREHAPATFFEIGDQIATYDPHGTAERQMLADGDMIGDHTWSHPNLLGLSAAEQRAQIGRAAAAVRAATGFEPCLFRAPYGAVDPSLLTLARSMGFATIQWNVDPADWRLPGVTAIIDDVVEDAHDGAIVEEHFGGGPRYETLDALPREIAGLRAKGYQLVTLTQMLGYKLLYR